MTPSNTASQDTPLSRLKKRCEQFVLSALHASGVPVKEAGKTADCEAPAPSPSAMPPMRRKP